MRFEELNLNTSLTKAIKELNYSSPTSIQEKAIPIILKKHDVLGSAQTGTGKTAAFALPILHHLINEENNDDKKKIKTLVITPTRELAIQIAENFTLYAKYSNIKTTVIFGGVKQGSQTDALNKGVDILVATPGRLLDLMGQGYISLKDISYFVLDEADRMLDMGFINDIKKVLEKLPKERQSLFFSATMPKNIIDLSNKILKSPQKIVAHQNSTTAETIQQYIYYTNKSTKKDLLFHILKNKDIKQILIFSRTKHGADRIVRTLKKQNINSAAIHGDKSQSQRQRTLKEFKENKLRVLVATDIAARGIDIDQLNYVLNYDIPNEAETYVHRIGRCGRAGNKGISISICEPEENTYVKDIEKLISKKIDIINDNPFKQTEKPMNNQQRKEFEKEKNRKRQDFFKNRKNKRRK
ncbi:MAG: DEAD/DEAH box helicase [Flavobacteriales bacterium]|jgi:ATP-dependent RNA helicase RhlE|tara:strand:+ start:3270 stop:4505 length:1236 start_codon:yes stop_codon:yes gene_type:complete